MSASSLTFCRLAWPAPAQCEQWSTIILATCQEVEEYLRGSAGIIILPIGSVEQHGPNGLIGGLDQVVEFRRLEHQFTRKPLTVGGSYGELQFVG